MSAKPGGAKFFHHVLKSPKHIVAPMVDQSELSWRLLARAYGAHLCYTPMLHSGVFVRDANYRKLNFTTCAEDRPLIVQFCGNDPDTVLEAAKYVEDKCDAVDLNLGCPQNIARRGRYGAFLQDEWDTISAIVKRLHAELSVPVTCKIRIFDDLDKTLAYARMLEESGCQLLTVHGRTRVQKGPRSGLANWDYIKAIKNAVSIPVVANGNILYTSDIDKCIEYTGVDGVMSSETHLVNPAVFSGQYPLLWEMVDEYMGLALKHGESVACCKAHLFKLYHKCVNDYPDLRTDLAKARSHDDLLAVAAALNENLRRRRDEEMKQGLWTEEHDTETAALHALPSCSPDFEHPRIPVWRCQPRPRNHNSDKALLEREPGPRAKQQKPQKSKAAGGEKSGPRAASDAANGDDDHDDDDESNAAKRPRAMDEQRAAQRKRQQQLNAMRKNRYKRCGLCNGNPCGKK
ncbi:hypothetical protein PTSG_01890 [Salpingoeca rosetta]|uniref:tRNA-dihydrouridine(16/17) synthase [NAD(P)(+)] n=1 Tax=Salpingoeca rosetta (strain ATCC 50818 / BSB-021) TaxID=946362 RepID=F2TZ91_SALR5|nr:uncharacterized protein PTSG_01890 [Salpingoeca rosetta]EGD78915.1 hypothetical protein PTSG_01890 [Salpingoeca rosetta]|eukprot:XP_004997871.1 hypothetical protein PTSG_01890 [Salpingoeca rosetta]